MDLDTEAALLPHKHFSGQRLALTEKLQILEAWDRIAEPNLRAALCHRIGVTPEEISRWNRARRQGKLVSKVGQHRSITVHREHAAQLRKLEKENEKLKRDLARAEGAVEALGKASELLNSLVKSSKPVPPPAPSLPPQRQRQPDK